MNTLEFVINKILSNAVNFVIKLVFYKGPMFIFSESLGPDLGQRSKVRLDSIPIYAYDA